MSLCPFVCGAILKPYPAHAVNPRNQLKSHNIRKNISFIFDPSRMNKPAPPPRTRNLLDQGGGYFAEWVGGFSYTYPLAKYIRSNPIRL